MLAFFSISFFQVNAQDTCATAQAITAGTYTVSTINGTQIPLPVCSPNGTGATNGEWYSYTSAINVNVTVTTDLQVNICKDTRIQVYTGSCDALVCETGDDDSGVIQCNGNNNNTSYLSVATFTAMAGVTYYIAFDDKWSDSGFDFSLIESEYQEPVVPRISFTNTNIALTGSYKECAVDMNNDFLDDIVGVSQNFVHIFYQNAEGGFTTNQVIPTSNAQFMPSWSTAAGDIDKDGYNDLLYGGGQGVTFMKSINNGTGFVQMSTSEYVFSQRSNFVDINNDGHLDAFVCHDVAPNVFYLNDGEGNLSFNQGGIGNYPSGGHYGSLWVDYDNDGDIDMFIAKCGGETARRTNQLFRNDGNGVFTEVGAAAGLADPIQTWSSAWADYDNDGDMDVLIGSYVTNEAHKLMRNNGDGTFTDVTAGSGWNLNTAVGTEYITYDFDNDGFADVLGSGGIVMFGNGDLTFTPFQVSGLAVGPVGDFNNDGFLDIQSGNTLKINNTNDNNWVKLNFRGIQSNGNGIGARVEIYGAWGKQIRDVRSGEGFAYMSSLNVHFGIGQATAIDQIIVRWPSGIVDTIDNPSINEAILVVEGETLSVNNTTFSSFKVYPNPAKDIVTLQSSNNSQVVSAEFFDLNGRKVFETPVVNETISIQSLATGTYILLAKDSEGTLSTHKLIKQ
ncbi:MAG: RNA-binding protein [Bacteroidetes bacterium HGW-Bacteroidetes-23]|nr:MAG: RNA-binding protein [Bacteroidetes bacterium HGW-Bacteroidetes-23]